MARVPVLTAVCASSMRAVARACMRGDLFGRDDALRDELLRVQLAHGRVRLDALVHLGLRVRGLVGFVVSEAAVPDQVDDHVVLEAAPEVDRQAHRGHARVDVVGVDVHDRHVEALRQIRSVARRARRRSASS